MPGTTSHPLIHINAFPSAGKLTAAKHLLALSANIKLIHNHLLVNPADAVLHRTQQGYQSLRRAFRTAIFTSLATEPTFNTTYVFTDFQTANEEGASSVCEEYAEAAKARGCLLIPIVLTCAEDENIRRMTQSEREEMQSLWMRSY